MFDLLRLLKMYAGNNVSCNIKSKIHIDIMGKKKTNNLQ